MHGVTAGGLAAGAAWAAMAAVLLVVGAPEGAPPACNLRRVTGVPCPACGGGRAAAALVQGDVIGAVAWNPLVVLGGPAAAVLVAAARSGDGRARRRRIAWGVAAAAVAANWGYVAWREWRGEGQKISRPSTIHAPAPSMTKAV